MAEAMSDAHLETVLASVGTHLVTTDAEAPRTTADRSRRRHRAAAMAAAVVLVVTTVGLTVAPVQQAVADIVEWLRLGSTRIERDPGEGSDPSGLPPIDAGLTPVPRDVAEATLGRPLPVVGSSVLGDPDLIALPPEGGVLLAWNDGATTLWIQSTEDPADVRVSKLLDTYDSVEPVAGLGDAAVLVEGEHVLRTPNRRLAADTVLLWIDDGFEYRLEADLGRPTILAVARSVRAA